MGVAENDSAGIQILAKVNVQLWIGQICASVQIIYAARCLQLKSSQDFLGSFLSRMATTMAQYLDGALAKAETDKARLILATKIKVIAQQVLEELGELQLPSAASFGGDVQTLICLCTLFEIADGFPSVHALGSGHPPAPRELDDQQATQVATAIYQDAKDVFSQSMGWGTFRTYKSLDVLTDNLFMLNSDLGWEAAGIIGCQLQHALASRGDFTVTVVTRTQWGQQ